MVDRLEFITRERDNRLDSFIPAMRTKSLKALTIDCCRALEDVNSNDMLESALRGEKNTLTEFTLDGLMKAPFINRILKAVQHNPVLESLTLFAEKEIEGEDVIAEICCMLRHNKSLKHFEFNGIMVNESILERTAESAMQNPLLRTLTLLEKNNYEEPKKTCFIGNFKLVYS